MRLIKPSVGECLDRLSILTRKIEEGKTRGVAYTHWEDEGVDIVAYLITWQPEMRVVWTLVTLYFFLAAVNAMIWDRQMEADRVLNDPESERSSLILELTRLNKRRAELVAQISGEERSREKI